MTKLSLLYVETSQFRGDQKRTPRGHRVLEIGPIRVFGVSYPYVTLAVTGLDTFSITRAVLRLTPATFIGRSRCYHLQFLISTRMSDSRHSGHGVGYRDGPSKPAGSHDTGSGQDA